MDALCSKVGATGKRERERERDDIYVSHGGEYDTL
jgi:hypothetical protein